jgi:hypothetical protein
MSMDGGTLGSLQDVNKQLISRLEGAGMQSISDLATATPYELLEDYHSNYDDDNKGIEIDFETISKLVHKAKQKLIEDGILQMDFYSAEKMLEIIFETEEESIDHLCQLFRLYGEKNNLEEIVSKAFESGLLQRQKKTLTYLTLDPDPKKVQQFYDLIDN